MITDASGRVLIARRPAGVHQGGLWEFPGGKCEPGESPRAALARELAEELVIEVRCATPICFIDHDYGDKKVRLHVQSVSSFVGQPRGAEGQPLLWVRPFDLWRYPFPEANRTILRRIALPRIMAIAGPCEHPDDFVARFERALVRGVEAFYLRIPAGAASEWAYPLASELCEESGCLLFVRSDLPERAGQGRHWRSGEWCQGRAAGYPQSAAVHSMAELEAAQKAGADLLLISPVQPTTSHPSAAPLGWKGFGMLARASCVPSLALGGVGPADAESSISVGGFGVAGISAFWG